MHRRSVAVALAVCGVVAVGAQTAKPTFEVASVKRNLSGSSSWGIRPQAGGVFNATNISVAAFVRFAYSIQDYQLVGGPDWVQRDRFDIAARAGRDVPTTELRPMVQALLEDRFKLVVHNEQREMPSFALVLARSDGRVGPGLQKLTDGCAKSNAQSKGPSDAPPGAVRSSGCGQIAVVVNMASREVGAPVIDKTGLIGMWDVFLYYSPDGARPFGGPLFLSPDRPAPDPNLPSFFTALQEQLGLKLERQQGLVDVLVIDSVQQPTEN
jgi:uncharacterized protein (TIGR03435 family)